MPVNGFAAPPVKQKEGGAGLAAAVGRAKKKPTSEMMGPALEALPELDD